MTNVRLENNQNLLTTKAIKSKSLTFFLFSIYPKNTNPFKGNC